MRFKKFKFKKFKFKVNKVALKKKLLILLPPISVKKATTGLQLQGSNYYVTYRRHTKSLREKLTSCAALLR